MFKNIDDLKKWYHLSKLKNKTKRQQSAPAGKENSKNITGAFEKVL